MRRLPLIAFLGNLAALTLLRVVFFLVFRRTAGALDLHDVLFAFYVGLKFDARLVAILVFPLLFLRRFEMAYLVFIESFLIVLYAADFGTYAYIHQRLNAGVLEFLSNPLISMHMIWESYHVVLFALTIIAGFSWVLAIVFIACMYSKFSRYPPLRWCDAYFMGRQVANVRDNEAEVFPLLAFAPLCRSHDARTSRFWPDRRTQ